jgi:hypothetical protein
MPTKLICKWQRRRAGIGGPLADATCCVCVSSHRVLPPGALLRGVGRDRPGKSPCTGPICFLYSSVDRRLEAYRC